ncbi:hypothetical protein L9F63_025474 [Diploptera punctata]|uniref:Tetratricopeptide repeat protein 1 n=1 Tax=Diploptera punctata TaxID=6984 RepID=A0AAD8E4L6_DIPPU|nr:hypothetical protein L9F63_025474 [Diploptera punctata]
MADNDGDNARSNCEIPSNKEIIDELTKDFDSVIIKTEENENNYETVSEVNKGDKIRVSESNKEINEVNPDDENNQQDEKEVDDFIDEESLKDLELTYSEEDKQRLRKEAESHKSEGNDHFKAGEFKKSLQSYTLALRTCPLAFERDRAVMYSNRGAAKMKMNLNVSAIEDCSKAIELDSTYLKAYYRRAQLNEATEKLDEALADYKKILELDPLHREALYASKRLPDQINERNEK